MVITRYKPLFSVTVSYELALLGVLTEGVTVEAVTGRIDRMKDLKLRPQHKKNTVTVFYEGIEKPINAPVTSEPVLAIDSEQYFYFLVGMANKERIKGLKFHATDAEAKQIGFPVLYDASIDAANGPATVTRRADIKIVSPVFTWTVLASDAGITATTASLEIRNEKNILINLNIPHAKLNDKALDGPGAQPEFAFTVDASSLDPGIYEFKTGAFSRKLFLANQMDITRSVCLVRVLKNNFLEYKKNLNDNSFAQFDLLIPKV